MSYEPIAYTYEASEHCVTCAENRFGPGANGTDNEGNPIGAVFEAFEDRPMSCGTCGEPITNFDSDGTFSTDILGMARRKKESTQYVSDTISEMVFSYRAESGKLKLTDILLHMAGDGVVESDGDQSDFGKWFALFEFNFWELQILEKATRNSYESIETESFPVGDTSISVTYVSTDWGRSFAIGEDYYRELETEYKTFLDNSICFVCGNEKYVDDTFCGGSQCDNATLEEPELRGPQNYELHRHVFEDDDSPCVECVRIAKEEASL